MKVDLITKLDYTAYKRYLLLTLITDLLFPIATRQRSDSCWSFVEQEDEDGDEFECVGPQYY